MGTDKTKRKLMITANSRGIRRTTPYIIWVIVMGNCAVLEFVNVTSREC